MTKIICLLAAFFTTTATYSQNMSAQSLIKPVQNWGCYANDSVIVRVANQTSDRIYFSDRPLTVTVSVSGAVSNILQTTLTSGSMDPNSTIDVTVGIVSMPVNGTYTFNAWTTFPGDIYSYNDTMPPTSRTKHPLSITNPDYFPKSFCEAAGTPTLSSNVLGASAVQWQMSTSSGTGFTNISGATTNPYTSSEINGTRYLKMIGTCGTQSVSSPEMMLVLDTPKVLSTSGPTTRCGAGSVTLNATAAPGTELFWYTSPAGGAHVGIGSVFTTPSLTSSTTYYVSAVATGITKKVGPTNAASIGNTVSVGLSGYLNFNISSMLKLQSVDIFHVSPYGPFGRTEKVYTNDLYIETIAGVVLQTIDITYGVYGQPTTIPIDLLMLPGAYRMEHYLMTNRLQGNSSGAIYPYTNGALSIISPLVAGPMTSSSYYSFYNWKFNTLCQSPRVPVTVTIIPKGGWLGTISNAWEVSGNWSCNTVPDATTNVVMPAGSNAVISSNVTINKLDLSPNATLTVKSGFRCNVLR